jgi:hypothetical protein
VAFEPATLCFSAVFRPSALHARAAIAGSAGVVVLGGNGARVATRAGARRRSTAPTDLPVDATAVGLCDARCDTAADNER